MLFPSLRNRGGFFSDYYLGTVFGRTGRRRSLVTKEVDVAFRRLERLVERAERVAGNAAALREAYARPLLRDVLGYHLGAGEGNVHGLFRTAEDEAAGRPPLLLAYVGSFDEDLDARRNGKAPPTQRLALELVRAKADLRYGLLLTGQRVRLIRPQGEGPRGAYLELDLAQCLEREDRESLAAALRLFGVGAFTPGEDGKLPIEAVEQESREHAERVSEDLKRAVFQTAERLIQALLDARATTDPTEEELTALRDAALTCLYRLLFVLYAEARDTRLLENPLYRDSYSLDALVRGITAEGEPPAPNRSGLWDRLLALFRIHGEGLPGVEGLDPLPARGGELFDPTTPAGRILEEVRLDDATVASVVLDLATTAPRRGVGKERVSFRELDIEQLGAVYEGLLEYEPRVAHGTTIEVRVQGRTYALPPAELVRLVREKGLRLKGPLEIVAGTEAEEVHPEAPTEEAEDEDLLDVVEGESEDAGSEGEEEGGVRKGAPAQLLRRLGPGRFHLVPGPGRKGSGSFYTPLPLVQDLVRHALGPLVEGRRAAEIEALRVLDPACGSAHFLVEAMRFLGQALHRAYVEEYDGKAPPGFRGEWDTHHEVPDEEARASGSEARAWCKRRIAERCLFGVDLNPTAVQLARVSLWIESLAGDRPLTYFAHHVRCGNSILGTWLERLGEPPLPDLRAKQPRHGGLMEDIYAEPVKEAVRKAADLRRLIDRAADEGAVEPETLEEQRFKEDQRRRAEETLAAARLLFDLRSASAFVPEIWAEWPQLCGLADDPLRLRAYAEARPWWGRASEVIARERFFHWELEFPEVFLDTDGGFDAVLGNPPWDKVKPDRKEFYGRHDVLIRAYVGGELDRRIEELHATVPGVESGFREYEHRIKTIAACLKKGRDYRYQDWEVDGKTTGGDPDAFKFFVERAHRLVRDGGRVGFVVPSAIYNNEGCTGLRHLLLEQAEVERFYAFENRKKIFPIHPQYKFVSLVFRKGEPSADGFSAAFMRHDLGELADEGSKDWMVLVRRSELERLSPGTLAFLEYRSPRDREILLKMYGYDAEGNPVNPRPLLGDQGPGTWNARFYTEFHMTNDRDLWTDPKTGKLWNPRQILGPVPGTTSGPPYYDPKAWPEIRERMAEAGFWPLYEGKKIHQFLVDVEPVERWLSQEEHMRKYGRPFSPRERVAYRNVSNVSNQRTLIAAVIPAAAGCGHKLTIVDSSDMDPHVMCTILNTLPFDYALRLRGGGGGGANLDQHNVARLPVPDARQALAVPSIITSSAAGAGYRDASDQRALWSPLARANVAVAEAYGLSMGDLSHVLASFDALARRRPEFFGYLIEELGNVA